MCGFSKADLTDIKEEEMNLVSGLFKWPSWIMALLALFYALAWVSSFWATIFGYDLGSAAEQTPTELSSHGPDTLEQDTRAPTVITPE